MKFVLFILVYNLANAQALTTNHEEWEELLSVRVADCDDMKLGRR